MYRAEKFCSWCSHLCQRRLGAVCPSRACSRRAFCGSDTPRVIFIPCRFVRFGFFFHLLLLFVKGGEDSVLSVVFQ